MSRPHPDCSRCLGTGGVLVSVLTRRHGVQSAEASCPECCAPAPEYVQAWRAAYHWREFQAACQHCDEWTHLRDDDGIPTHWVCAARAAHCNQARKATL
jgi:phage terminase large subunit GpA-like protein